MFYISRLFDGLILLEKHLRFLPIILSTAFITNASYAQPFDPQPSANQVEIPNIGSGIGLLDQQKEKFIGEKVFVKFTNKCPLFKMSG